MAPTGTGTSPPCCSRICIRITSTITSTWSRRDGARAASTSILSVLPGSAELHRFLVTFFRDDLVYRWLVGGPRGIDEEGMFKGVDIREITGSNEFDLEADEGQDGRDDSLHVRPRVPVRREGQVSRRIRGYGLRPPFDSAGRGCRRSRHRRESLGRREHAATASAVPCRNSRPSTGLRVPYRGDPDAPNHMPLPDVARVAVGAGVGTVVLTHLWPLPVDERLIDRTEAAFVAGGFEGQVVFAEDGLEVAV